MGPTKVLKLHPIGRWISTIPLIISLFRVEVGHGARNKPLFVAQHQDDFTQKRMWERVGELDLTGRSVPPTNSDAGSCG